MSREWWIKKCQRLKEKWSVYYEQPNFNDDRYGINLYKFIDILSNNLKEDSVVTYDAGSNLYVNNQGLRLNGKNQRLIGSMAQAELGAVLGLSVGVSFAKNKGEVICTVGDGSFCTQLQELSVIRQHNLPIKIFIWDNFGFLSIRNSQKNFYNNRVFGSDSDSGLYFPDFSKIASAYGISYMEINTIKELESDIKYIMNLTVPIIVKVKCDPNQNIWPTSAPRKDENGKPYQTGLHDLAFLSKEEIEQEMIKN
jgi:acetolactate synthase I/II/III large subunit